MSRAIIAQVEVDALFDREGRRVEIARGHSAILKLDDGNASTEVECHDAADLVS